MTAAAGADPAADPARAALEAAGPLRVLVVDDSRIFRAAVEEAIRGSGVAEVAGSVWSGGKALEFVERHWPDLVTLDLEMPEMSGLDTLRGLARLNARRPAERPVGALVLSAHSHAGAEVTLEALEAGAFDFLPKPVSAVPEEGHRQLADQLREKLRAFAEARRGGRQRRRPAAGSARPETPVRGRLSRPVEAIGVAASTGGPVALAALLPELTRRVQVPVLVVQHIPSAFSGMLAERLARLCPVPVAEARDGEPLLPGRVYLAPGGRHLLVRTLGDQAVVGLSDQPPENNCRPSADVLFRSLAAAFGGRAAGVVLTGMGSDGARGLAALRRAGGLGIAQDEAGCVVWGMPGAAVAAGGAERILPLDEIPAALAAAAPSA